MSVFLVFDYSSKIINVWFFWYLIIHLKFLFLGIRKIHRNKDV